MRKIKLLNIRSLFIVILIFLLLLIGCRNKEESTRNNTPNTLPQVKNPGSDLKTKFFYIVGLVQAENWSKFAEMFDQNYNFKKKDIHDNYSFDQNELSNKLAELDREYSRSYSCRKFPEKQDCRSIFSFSQLDPINLINSLFKSDARVDILENKSDIRQCVDYEMTQNKKRYDRLVIKISYSDNNCPYYYNLNSSFLSAGIYESRDVIINAHEGGNFKVPESAREEHYKHIHPVKEVTVIVEDCSEGTDNNTFLFPNIPNISIYSLSAIDGFSFKNDLNTPRLFECR